MKEKLDCGHVPTVDAGVGTGYARHAVTNKTMCYGCADSQAAADMSAEDKYGAYLSGDGKNITTWSGGVLARVTYEGKARTGFHDSEITYLRARDANGATWYGRNGGRGMCVTIKRAKNV